MKKLIIVVLVSAIAFEAQSMEWAANVAKMAGIFCAPKVGSVVLRKAASHGLSVAGKESLVTGSAIVVGYALSQKTPITAFCGRRLTICDENVLGRVTTNGVVATTVVAGVAKLSGAALDSELARTALTGIAVLYSGYKVGQYLKNQLFSK